MDVDKIIPVVNLLPVRFICGTTRQGRTVIIQGACNPEIFVAVITMVGVKVGEALNDIGMNSRKVMINMKCNGEESWVSHWDKYYQPKEWINGWIG